jgi:hypothetical protein
LFGIQADVGVEDRDAPTNCVDVLDECEYIGAVQVVEDAQAENYVEPAIFLYAQVANVVLMELDICERKCSGCKARLLDIRRAAFDCAHLRTLPTELDAIAAFQARQVHNS